MPTSVGGVFLPYYDATITGTWSFTTPPAMTSPTLTTPTITSPVITGNGATGVVVSKIVPFVEVATLTTHTGTVTLPAGSLLLDIYFWSTVLWTATDAAVVIGDANQANGWMTSLQLDTTDLVVGERFQASNPNNWAGTTPTYLTTAGRFGQQSANVIGGYCPNAYSVIAVCSKTGAGTAGRSFLMVTYAVGESVAPVVA